MQNYTKSVTNSQEKAVFRYTKDALQIVGGSLFLAFSAQFVVPFLPVPLTMQTFAVMILGLTLGKVKGSLSVLAYIIESMMGLPVLSHAAVAPLAIVGLRGGYIFGMVIQAYLVGSLREKSSKLSYVAVLASLILIAALQLSLGTLWLGSFIGLTQAFMVGFVPFIIGEVVKCTSLLYFVKK